MDITRKHKIIFISIAILIFTGISVREMLYQRQNTYILASSRENPSMETTDQNPVSTDNALPTDLSSDQPDRSEESQLQKKVVIHVEGQVRNPGVYQLVQGDRVADVIELAGGLLENADRRRVNLAKKLQDEMFLFIPHEDDEQDHQISFAGSLNDSHSGSGASTQSELVNINTAETDRLETLPGIGPVLARRIVDHRQRSGPFDTVESLKDVSGIGDSRYQEVRELIKVR